VTVGDREGYRKGYIYTLSAYGIWGIAPLYFHALSDVGPLEILCHRVVWSVLFLFGLLMCKREAAPALALFRRPDSLATLAVSSALICGNWLLFIYAIETSRTLEASFGYFINPLLTVGLGVVVLGERLTRVQWICLSVAACGVLVQLFALGSMPWIALTLAVTFGFYGLVRKRTAIPALSGLAVETLLATPLACAVLAWLYAGDHLSFAAGGMGVRLLLLSAGVVTSIPLVLFVAGTQRLPLTVVGFLQFLAPTGQFLCAVIVFQEPLGAAKLFSFGLIWASLVLFVMAPRLDLAPPD
jgi:chloramphenicol-sensitive protein RarD